MHLSRTLLHLAQLKRISSANNGWGDVDPTSPVTVSCFLHGSDSRRLDPNGQEVQVDCEMWVSPSTSIAVNDAVETVTSQDGDTLLAAGRVVAVERHDHPTLGEIATRALLVRN